jgi:hypothetical protein
MVKREQEIEAAGSNETKDSVGIERGIPNFFHNAPGWQKKMWEVFFLYPFKSWDSANAG